MYLVPVTLSIVDGEQPDANGVEFGLFDGIMPDRVYDWFTVKGGVDDDHPDRWVLVTPGGEHPGELRNLVASLETYAARSPQVEMPTRGPVPLSEFPAAERARYTTVMLEMTRRQMSVLSELRAAAYAELVARHGLEPTAVAYGLVPASLETFLRRHGWGKKAIAAAFPLPPVPPG